MSLSWDITAGQFKCIIKREMQRIGVDAEFCSQEAGHCQHIDLLPRAVEWNFPLELHVRIQRHGNWSGFLLRVRVALSLLGLPLGGGKQKVERVKERERESKKVCVERGGRERDTERKKEDVYADRERRSKDVCI